MKTILHTVKYKKRHYTKDEIAEILMESLYADELQDIEDGKPIRKLAEGEFDKILDEWYQKELDSWTK